MDLFTHYDDDKFENKVLPLDMQMIRKFRERWIPNCIVQELSQTTIR